MNKESNVKCYNALKQCLSVWDAQDEDGFLEFALPISIEVLGNDMNGIFKNQRSWKSFINKNFIENGCIKDTPSASTIKRWCMPLEEYSSKFAVQVGMDKWVGVNPEDLDFTYSFEFIYLSGSECTKYPSMVEFYVTATFKKLNSFTGVVSSVVKGLGSSDSSPFVVYDLK